MANKTSETLLEGSQTSSFTLRHFAALLIKRMWMIVAITVALPTLVGVVVSKQPKIYQATASVIIDSTVPQYLGSSFKDVVDVENNWWSAQELLQTELKVIKSNTQAVRVARALCRRQLGEGTERGPAIRRLLVGSSECGDPEKEPEKIAAFDASCSKEGGVCKRAALALQNMVTVSPVRDTRVVQLTVEFNEPTMTAFLADLIAAEYIEHALSRRLEQSAGAATWLGDEYGDLVTQLNDAEKLLLEFRKKNNVVAVSLEDQQNDLSMRRKKLSEELGLIQIKLIGVRAMRDQYASLQSDNPMEDLRPGVADNPMLLKLKSLYVDEYSKLLELRGKYLDKHPMIIAHEERLAGIKSDLKREAILAQKQVDSQYESLMKQERDLRSALEVTTRDTLALEQKAIEFHRLKRNFDRLAKLSEQVGGRERESSLAGHLKTNSVHPLDAALVPTSPVAPNVLRAVLVSLVVALALAIGLAFLLELLDSTVKSQDDVEAGGLVFLGLLPKIVPSMKSAVAVPPAVADLVNSGSTDLHVLAYPRSAVAECCRAIRTNILFMTPDKPARSLLVTSAGPREGKTTTAISLAITMAQSGLKVLIIDTDMRRPRLHKAFGIPATPDGISRAILGEVEVMSVVRESGIPNLWVLPCGALPPNPAELLHAERFHAIVDELQSNFDRLIFDSPPVGAVTDASILSRLTSGTVLVAKSNETSKDTLALLAKRLKADGSVNVLGCILNDLDLTRKAGNYYQYYAKYGYYGGYGDDIDDGKGSGKPANQST